MQEHSIVTLQCKGGPRALIAQTGGRPFEILPPTDPAEVLLDGGAMERLMGRFEIVCVDCR
jgi:hypothetical protein